MLVFIFTVEIFAVLNEIIRFLACGESFTIVKFIKKSFLLLPLVNDATDTCEMIEITSMKSYSDAHVS